MLGLEHGIERGFAMVVEAAVVAVVFSAFVKAGLVPRFYFFLFNAASIAGLVFLIDKTRYWSWGYLLGWLLGLSLSLGTLIQTEMLTILDLLLYAVIAAGALYVRTKIHLN